MHDYMCVYYYASTEERLYNIDTRYPEIFNTAQESFQYAYDACHAYARRKHGISTKILITSITDKTATSYLSGGLNNG